MRSKKRQKYDGTQLANSKKEKVTTEHKKKVLSKSTVPFN